MAKREPDPNEDAARVIREMSAAGAGEVRPGSLEAAWADWSKRIKAADERTMTLLRAAFEAGFDAGRRRP